MKKKAVVLLSGGLDSATCLYWAKAQGFDVVAFAVQYGQRHARERASAQKLALAAGVRLVELKISLPWLKVSALVDPAARLPDVPVERISRNGIPSTYVPARNAIFLALAASLAEAEGADRIVIGANAIDYSGYPDCRPEFTRAFEEMLSIGTRAGAEGRRIAIEAPLIRLDKCEIIKLAGKLGVPIERTWSCYLGGKKPCGRCDSCKLRAKGFVEAGIEDPA